MPAFLALDKLCPRSSARACVVAAITMAFSLYTPLLEAQDRHVDPKSRMNQVGAAPQTAARPLGGSKGPVVSGEPFSTRVIFDTAQRLPVGVLSLPAKWSFDSRVAWNYQHVELPVTLSYRAENPENEEAIFVYPMEAYYELNPPDRITPIGQGPMGYIHLPPMTALATLVRFIQRTRQGVVGLEIKGYKELPGLAHAMKADQFKQDIPPTGLGVKVTYSLSGKPVEEEFYGVSMRNTVPYDGPQGRSYQTYWGMSVLFSFRAPAGTLDKRRPVFAASVKSFRPNPAWQARAAAIQQYLNAQFNRMLQQGYAQIAAAVALSKQISANNDAMIANIDRQLTQSRSAHSNGERTEADKFDDYIRGVDTLEDPYYGSTQLSSNNQFHWTDGFGSYRSSNNALYDPNQSEVGNWTPMRQVR